MKEVALIKSKVERKQILWCNHVRTLLSGSVCSGWSLAFRQAAQYSLASLLSLRRDRTFTFWLEGTNFLQVLPEAIRSEAIFLVCGSGEGHWDWSPCLCAGVSGKTSNTFHHGVSVAFCGDQALSTHDLFCRIRIPGCPGPCRAPVGPVHRASVSQNILEDCEEGRRRVLALLTVSTWEVSFQALTG